MSGRAIISCFSHPSTSCNISLSRRTQFAHAPPPSPLLLSRRSHLVVAGGRGGGKVWANVKSEKNVSESPKYEDVVVQKGRGLDNMEEEGKWWQVFPKRWVIVVLCFSAFLLCNMDRVCTSALSLFFQLHCSFLIACDFVHGEEAVGHFYSEFKLSQFDNKARCTWCISRSLSMPVAVFGDLTLASYVIKIVCVSEGQLF